MTRTMSWPRLMALAMAADRLEMTPGSLWMIHDPSVVAWGNERELMDSIRLLQACKESILNVYQRRCRQSRQEVAAMMSAQVNSAGATGEVTVTSSLSDHEAQARHSMVYLGTRATARAVGAIGLGAR